MHSARKLVFWLLLVAASSAAARADSLAGYTRRVWQASDGLPEQTVQAFAQTPDGYLWVGTTGGLVRFDGMHFTVFDRQNTPLMHENSVFCLKATRDGALWIGTEGGGIGRYANGVFRFWTVRDGLSNEFVRSVIEDRQGTIWVGTDNGLLRMEGERLIRVDGTAMIPQLAVHALYQDREDRIWVGGSKLLTIQGKTVTEYTLRGEASQNRVKSITQTQDGTVWVGTVTGLIRLLPGHNSFERVPGINGTVRALQQTEDSVLWIGTIGLGAFESVAGKLSAVTAPATLPSNTVLNFFEDSERNIWIGTQAGMMRLTHADVSIVPLPKAADSDFETLSRDPRGGFWIGSTQLFEMQNGTLVEKSLPGLGGVHVRQVYRDRSNVLWAGTDGDGVYRIAPEGTTHLTTREGLSNNFVRAMTQDRDGSMWIAADEGISHVLEIGAKRVIHSYQMRDGLAYFSTRALHVDRKGDLWVGTDRGLSHVHDGAFVSDAATETLEQTKIWAIHEDADGGLWFGTRNAGLYRLRDGKIAHYTVADGLPDNAIYQILEDGAGHFWMSGPNGITLLDRHELDAQAEKRTRHLKLTFYSTAGMPANTEIYGGTQPSGCITADGEVWFPSNLGPIHMLPLAQSKLLPPPLRIQNVLADGLAVEMARPIVLPPGSHRLEVEFAPVRLGSQDGLRFTYILEGFETNWSPASQQRTAEYTNLPAGNYRFRVRTFDFSSPDQVSEASIQFVQRPFFYRTWWFLAGCIALVALLIYGAYQYRVRQMRSRLEAVVEERSRLAREMHDTVIQGCTGVSALLEAVAMDESNTEVDAGLMDVARVQLRSTIDEAREAIWNLRQPDRDATQLGENLRGMAEQVSEEFHIPVACAITGMPFSVSHPIAHDLLMVAREAVYNSTLHGQPSRVEVALTYSNRELVLGLSDDGCGFNPQVADDQDGRHFGLRGMRERIERSGGQFRLTSAVGSGVRIEVRLPRSRARASALHEVI